MKRRDFVKSAVAGAAVTASTGVSSMAFADEEKTRMRMQSYWGKEGDAIFDTYLDNVKTASDGSIRIKRFPGSAIVPDADMLQGVSSGTIDMCQGFSGYWPGKVDIAAIEAGLPGAWNSYDEAYYIFKSKGLEDLIREAYAEQDVHYMGPVFGGAFDLLSKVPVKSLSDMQKLKIRATPSVAKVLQQLDIPTVFLPGSELYVGLSTGAIDGCIYGGPIEYKTMKLYEVANNYTFLNMVSPGYADDVLINKKKWESLSDTQRKIMQLAFEAHAANMHNWIVTGNIEAGAGDAFVYHTLSPEDTAALVEAAQVVWEEEAARSERNKKAIEILKEAAQARM